MSTEPQILTRHPQGKKGVNILLRRYEQVKVILLDLVKAHEDISFEDLSDQATKQLMANGFDGKPLWYIVTVKLDLEARGDLERIPKTSPHRLRLGS